MFNLRFVITLFIAMSFAFQMHGIGVVAQDENASGKTKVKVERGSLTLKNDEGVYQLQMGQRGQMIAKQPPKPFPADGKLPIDVSWEAGASNLRLNGEQVSLEEKSKGQWFASKKSYEIFWQEAHDFIVWDRETNRVAIRKPNGTWIHEFGGVVLTKPVNGSQKVEVIGKPDSRVALNKGSKAAENLSSNGFRSTDNPVGKKAWKVGVILDQKEKGEGRLIVGGFSKNSPAEKAGMQVGDWIVNVNGLDHPSSREITQQINSKKLGEKIDFLVKRKDVVGTRKISIVVGENGK